MDNRSTTKLEEHHPLFVSDRGLRSRIRFDRAHLKCDLSAEHTSARELAEDRRSAKLEVVDHIAARIAHDLNNVLSTICGYGALAQRQLGPGETSRYIDKVLKASVRAQALTQQLFAVGRSGSDPETLVCIQRTVEEVLEWVAIALPEGVQLQTTLWAGNAHLLADPTQICRLVMNLCTNAVHAMERGGVLTVVLDEVSVPIAQATTHGSLLSGVYVRLAISDTGTGIAPGVLEHIFDPFFTTKDAARGSGLGLAIVRSIVRALGGAIDVKTDVGIGTTFAVWLRTSGAAMSCASHSDALDLGTEGMSNDGC